MSHALPIPTSSPLYPLPADYESLTGDGKRQARVNAARQWLIPTSSLEERADRMVASTWFFDTYYLHPDPAHDFDPLFYDMKPLETPGFHWDLSRMWATNRLNVTMAPRGGAKSTHCRRDMLTRLITAPAYSFVYASSTHDNAKHTGQILRDQCYENERVIQDFGSLKPSRGAKPSGAEYFYLNNGSWVRVVSSESRIRGLRPRRFRLDDPEYDEKASTSMQQLRVYMDNLLFKICLPMVMRAECGVDWIGTFVSKRHYLWHAMQTVQTPQGLVAQDPRFNWWARLWIRAAFEDQDGAIRSCWPSMWPATEDDRHRAGLHDSVSLEKMKELMGVAAFNGEMLGKPGSSEEQYFKLDPSAKGRHAYWYENADDFLLTKPALSQATICWLNKEGATQRKPLIEFLTSSRLFVTVDTAYTENSTSDRRACTLMAVTSENELFVLDMWSDKKGDNILIQKTLDMCQAWRCPIIYVEVVKESFKLYQRFRSTIHTKVVHEMGYSYIPSIKDFRPGTMSKTEKISALDLRFEHGLIKLPIYRRYEKPHWTRLLDQIEGFNPEVEGGGLDKDDEIDTISMSIFVIKGRFMRTQKSDDTPKLDPIEEIKKGNFYMAGGCAYGMGLPLQLLDAETVGQLIAQHKGSPDNPSRKTRV